MPRWLRQFTFNKIDGFYRKEAEEHEKSVNNNSNKSTLVDPSGKINKKAFKEAQPMVTSGPSKSPSTTSKSSSKSKVRYK